MIREQRWDEEENVKQEFQRLVGRLSPENLTRDGELSKNSVIKELRAIKKEWHALEKRLGRPVYEDELFD